ncbi:MAG: PilZ domain-containing protein [Thalassotalea sp.]
MSDSSMQDNSERRQFFRIDMEEELIDIIWQDDAGKEQRKKITCLDFSRGGVRADCDEEIPQNTNATVIFQAADPTSQQLHGRVLRCVKLESGGYQIALQLVD